ncbi:hypothetical protein RB653_007648 [Dictyostelium firmibasis]|uniref:Fanconi-associated nuclease n=1 Tax=Dictyostelium firmibasis TaxID=79012 RepID=A0AAN7TNY5_9MYCE
MKSNTKNNVKRKSPPPVNPNKKFPSFEGKQTSIKDFFLNDTTTPRTPTQPVRFTPKINENDNNYNNNNNSNNNSGNNTITPIKKTTTTTTVVVESFDDTRNTNLIQQFQKASSLSSSQIPNKLPQPNEQENQHQKPTSTQQQQQQEQEQELQEQSNNLFKTIKTTTTTETFEEFLLTQPTTPPSTTTTMTTTSTSSSSTPFDNQNIEIIDKKNRNNNNNRYYLNDFLIVTETVYKRDKHLFINDEKDYIEGMIETLDRDSQHLFVRLYNRKGPWFQINELKSSNYQNEINSIGTAVETLVEYGFLEYYSSDKHDYNDIATLLKVDQLKSIAGSSLSNQNSSNKETFLKIISGEPFKGQTTLFSPKPIYKKKVENLVGECIKIVTEVVDLWRMIHHLYFYSWSTHDSKSMIVNNIMGIKYPEYTVWKSKVKQEQKEEKEVQQHIQIKVKEESNMIDLTQNSSGSSGNDNINNNINNREYDIDLTENESIFPNRESLLKYENARKLEEKSINLYESGGDLVALESILQICLEELGRGVSKKVKYSFALKFTIGWVYTRILSWSIDIFEKLRKYQQCIDYLMLLIESPYCRGKRGYWWQRMIINHKHLHRNDDALLIAERSLKEDPFLRSGDRLAIEKHLIQLASPPRRWRIPAGLIQFSYKLKEPLSTTIHREKVSNNQQGYKSKYLFLTPQIKINKIKKIIIKSSQSQQTKSSQNNQQTQTQIQTQNQTQPQTPIQTQNQTPIQTQINNNNIIPVGSQKSIDSIITTTTINNTQSSSQNIYIDEETSLEITSDDELFPPGQGNNIEYEKEKENKLQVTTCIVKKEEGKEEEEEEEDEEIIEITHGTVEEVSLEYYSKTGGWEGIHCETSIFITLYVLYFWDIIFDSNVPHVFQSPFQNSPLDFGSDEFYFTRKEAIDKRIKRLEHSNHDDLLVLLNNSWLHNGCEARGVNWKSTTIDQLSIISKCLGGKLIAFISRLLTEDFKSFSHGMPDLFLWKIDINNTDNNNYKNSSIKFVEVKGTGDRLRDQQRIWIDMLISFGCDVEVCHIKNKKD